MASLDPKAILAGRMPGRPSVGAIVTIALSSLALLGVLGYLALDGPTFTVGLLLALLPLPLLLAGVLALDRLEPEPPDALLMAFLWGAGISVLLAMILNTAGLMLVWAPLLGEDDGFYFTATVAAPIVEEGLKGLVLFGLLWFRRHELNGPTDGIIYGSMVGLGFATIENISYYMAAGPEAIASTFVLRGIVTPLIHPLCTSLTGIGVATAAMREPGRGRMGPALLGLLGAIALHATWNGMTRFGFDGVALAYGVGIFVLVLLLGVVRRDRRRIVAQISQHLPAYAGTGVVTDDDVRMLSTLPGRQHARAWVRRHLGAGPARAMRDYQQAATELAMLHRRYERGLLEQPEFERRRQDLVLLMHVARQVFLPPRTIGR
jgi:RsiW-degrading membrane proteinase PrsW (M82 family)